MNKLNTINHIRDMAHKIEIVYYNLWGDKFHHMVDMYIKMPLSNERYIDAVSVEANNKLFLECYNEEYNNKGFNHCDMWLRGMLVDYVKRCSLNDGEAPYYRHYYEEWINNTKWISREFKELQSWCDDYMNYINNNPLKFATKQLPDPDTNKPIELSDISELREAASGYLSMLQVSGFVGYNYTDESVSRLHRAIANVDLGKIGEVLAQRNVNQNRIIEELVEPTLIIIGDLKTKIGDNMPKIIKTIDPEVGKVFKFCKEAITVLSGEYENLKSRRYTDPTAADDYAVEKLHLYELGLYDDLTFEEFITEHIIKDDPDIAVTRRLKNMISKCTVVQVKRDLSKFLYWRKCDKDVISELHDAFVDFYRFFDHAANVSPIPPDRNRDEVTTQLFNVLEWCKQHDNELKTQLVNRPLLKDVENLCILATHICESFDNWSSIIGSDAVTLELFNGVADILDNVIVPTIEQRNPTSPKPEPTPEPQPSPSVEESTKDDAPDFSHMKSYTPKIKFEMSALYSFLINEEVIKDIDLKLFADCITHAHMNEVWKVGNHHKLKCVFRHLKDHFPNDWIDVVAQRMNTTRKIITAIERTKIGDFERKLRDIV